MEIKVKHFKNYKKPKKNTFFRIQVRISIEKCSFPVGKLSFYRNSYVYKELCFLRIVMAFENYSDIQEGDMIECFEITEVARTLD